ncbi:hypothetical protein [Zunongwangia profunda]|uniref:hypothetical protein n=1 Tax=Zunongwangia profunda TaxID=398743 RepID=UPI001D1813CC|nr:hypothetical protein [Zunongwangia profunda]MCC4226812.1 hypothetical protein [Zunongwangia profunda]
MEFRWSGLRSRFQIGNGEFLPRASGRVTEWKGEIGDGVTFLGKRCRSKCSFSRNAGECAEWFMKTDILLM